MTFNRDLSGDRHKETYRHNSERLRTSGKMYRALQRFRILSGFLPKAKMEKTADEDSAPNEVEVIKVTCRTRKIDGEKSFVSKVLEG